MKDEFEQMVAKEYPSLLTINDLNRDEKEREKDKNKNKDKPVARRCSLMLEKKQPTLSLEFPLADEEIMYFQCYVGN